MMKAWEAQHGSQQATLQPELTDMNEPEGRSSQSKRKAEASASDSEGSLCADMEGPTTPPQRPGNQVGEATTPQVLKKLSKVARAGEDSLPSPTLVATRILQWAGEAQAKLDTQAPCPATPQSAELEAEESPSADPVPISLVPTQPAAIQVGEVQVFKYTKDDAAQVEKLVQAFKLALKAATAHLNGNAGPATQLDVCFREPILRAKDLATKIERLHGLKGPFVDVQWLKTSQGCSWKRPGAGSFWAETKGDDNLFVLSLNVPGTEKPGMKRASKMSFQLKTSSKALKIKAAKRLLLHFAPNLIMLFGPHDNVAVANTGKTGGLDLSSFWG